MRAQIYYALNIREYKSFYKTFAIEKYLLLTVCLDKHVRNVLNSTLFYKIT